MAAIWREAIDLARLTALGESVLPGLLEIEFTACGDDWLTARMPVGPKVHQPWGRLHGGASVVLAETVASVAATMAAPAGKGAVGLEINANHVRPAASGHVHATARPEALGRTTQVWTVRIVDDAGRLVCTARMTAAVIEMDQGAVRAG